VTRFAARLSPIALAVVGLLAAGAGPAHAQESPPSPPTGVQPATASELLVVDGVRLSLNGTPADAAPPGVEVRVTVTLLNVSDKTASDIRASFRAFEGVRVTGGEVSYPSLAPNARAEREIAIVSEQQPCQEFVGLVVEGTSSIGSFAGKFTVPTSCPGPRLFVDGVTYRGGDGDQAPEPGERLDVLVGLSNHGRDPARGVSGRLRIATEGVTVVEGAAAWPDLKHGAASENATPFVIDVAPGARVQQGCPTVAPQPDIIVIEGTAAPDAATSSGSGAAVSSVPPAPEPQEGAAPPPAAEDLGVGFEAKLVVSTTSGPFELDYSNIVVCALTEIGIPAAGAAPPPGQKAQAAGRDSEQSRGGGGAALPAGLAGAVSLGAVGARFALGRLRRPA
jgi:hypothetical protein